MSNIQTLHQKAQLEAECAFDRAIEEGRLSSDPAAANYAGHYMYMGRNSAHSCDAFKHILSREYLALSPRGWAGEKTASHG